MNLMNAISPSHGLFADSDDRSLWLAFQNGNKDAFRTLYCRFFHCLVKAGLLITGNKEVVLDCIHDLFVEIWESRNNLSVPYSVRAYLVSSIRRKVIRCLDRMIDETSVSFREHNMVLSPEDEIVDKQSRSESEHYVLRALNCLTRRQKEAVFLKFYVNLDYSEISQKMSISKESVYNLISKAIDALRMELSPSSAEKLKRN